MEDGFTMPPEPVTEDGDMTRLVLQHCVMPAYQFIIQVAPDQTSVTHLTCLMLCLISCMNTCHGYTFFGHFLKFDLRECGSVNKNFNIQGSIIHL